MNKAELVAKMAEKSGMTKKDTEVALNSFMASVEEALVAGEKVQLVGFGNKRKSSKRRKKSKRSRKEN